MPNLESGHRFGGLNEVNFMHIPSTDRAICINIPFSIGLNKNTSFVVDTGSAISLIKANKLIQTLFMNLTEKIILNGISKAKINTYGTIYGEILLKNKRITHKFYIVPDDINLGSGDGILGMDFLEAHKIWLDMENGNLFFKDEIDIFRKHSSNHKTFKNLVENPQKEIEITTSSNTSAEGVCSRDKENVTTNKMLDVINPIKKVVKFSPSTKKHDGPTIIFKKPNSNNEIMKASKL